MADCFPTLGGLGPPASISHADGHSIAFFVTARSYDIMPLTKSWKQGAEQWLMALHYSCQLQGRLQSRASFSLGRHVSFFWGPVPFLCPHIAFFDFGTGKLILEWILAHLQAMGFCELYKQVSMGSSFTELWCRCGWKQWKWCGEELPNALKRMQTGVCTRKDQIQPPKEAREPNCWFLL